MVAEVTPKIEATKETEIAKAASAPEVKKELVAPAPKVKSVAPKKMYKRTGLLLSPESKPQRIMRQQQLTPQQPGSTYD